MKRAIADSNHGLKKQKKSKFGRNEKRKITRTTQRSRFGNSAKTAHNNEHANASENENSDDDDDDDEEGEYFEDDEIKQKTIAGKRNKSSDNKLAYSALVTLLKSEHEKSIEETPDKNSMAIDKSDIEESEDDEQDAKIIETDDEDAQLDQNAKEEDNLDVLNKFDAFNLHFNDEDKIEKLVEKFNKLPVKDQQVKLIKRLQINGSFGNYSKLKYGFPHINEESELNSGNSVESKLKFHNVKKKIQDKFKNFDSFEEIDIALIESMFKYETINLQYYHNEYIKSRYQDYYTLHISNHILKTRDRILNNNEKKSTITKQIEEGQLTPADEPDFRDQGYARPKALIILPNRNIAWQVVNKLIKNSCIENVDKKHKFKSQFYDSFKVNEMMKSKKPKDFEEFFDGNAGDFFTLGIKFTRKTMKLYTKLENSDVIIASPLGLKMLLDKTEGKRSNNEILSSIEICVIDKAEGLLMQNWEHLFEILNKRLNSPPKNFDGLDVDFSRIRMWAINDQYSFVTQILTFNKYLTPELMGIIKKSKNLLSGCSLFKSVDANDNIVNQTKLKMVKQGLINKFTSLKQIFMRFDFNIRQLQNEPDKRFEFFKNVTLPQILNKTSYNFGTLIYFASYLDYIRVVNYLQNETKVSFVAIDEYSSQSKMTRNRALFDQRASTAKVMLYTERLHFYKRYDIKGVRNVVFYQLPSDPDFYQQVLQFIGDEKIRVEAKNSQLKIKSLDAEDDDEEEDDNDEDDDDDQLDLNLCMVRTQFDRLDTMKLEKVVGLKNSHELITGENEMYEFS